jgi:hypothetical protein
VAEAFLVSAVDDRDNMERPGFLRNNEEWIIWLLAGEKGGSSTPEALAEQTTLPLDQLHDNLLYLERVKIVSLERDDRRRYPQELSRVKITSEGQRIFEELKERPDLGEDDLF